MKTFKKKKNSKNKTHKRKKINNKYSLKSLEKTSCAFVNENLSKKPVKDLYYLTTKEKELIFLK